MKKEIDFNKELRVNGASNILISLGFGLVSYTNLVITIINSDLKSTNRIPGILAAIFTFLILVAGMNLIAFIPKIIPFGLLFFIGFSILKTWTYDIRHAFYAMDYICIFMILATVLFLGLLAGILVGILVSIISITIHYSRISPIKYRVEGNKLRSGTQRDKFAENILEKSADSILLIKLQNYLFFGIVSHLVDDIKNTLASRSNKLQTIIYDFEFVPGMDASGLHCFLQIKSIAKSHKITLVITEINKHLHEKLIKNGFLEPDNASIVVISQNQQAIEWCEEQVLAKNNYRKNELISLESQFNNMINNDFSSRSIRKYFNKLRFKKKDILTKQGDPASSLYYLESGELSVFRTNHNDKKIFISTIHPGSIIGEMGLYSGIKRTATIIAKKDVIVNELTIENFEKMCAEEPKLAEKFHRIIISILIYRLK